MAKRVQLSISCILAIALLSNVHAQSKAVWAAFYYRADVKDFAGRNFRMHAAVKAVPSQKNAHAALWARVDKKDQTQGFFYNMNDKPITNNKWKVYSISGKIDDNAKYLFIGGLFQENGIFSYDDFQLEIQNKEGDWEKQEIPNGGFEADTLESSWGFFGKKTAFKMNIRKENAFEKKQYFEISGSEIVHPAAYGTNDSTGRSVRANGIKIYYEEYGSGEPLLLLHGNSQSIISFSRQIPELAKSYRVIAVDTRGHGNSSDQNKRYTYDLFADDMNAFLDKLHIDSANIVGWSDGGNTGLIMAMKYPKKVKKLVTMGAVIFIDSTVVKQHVLDTIALMIGELKTDASSNSKKQLKKTTLLLEEPRHSYTELAFIKCSVLVMAGETDIVKHGHTTEIASAIPAAELKIVAGETHYFPEENPEEFNRLVLEFLNKR